MRLYRTPVGVISGLILFRLVTFWGRSAMGWSVPFSLGEFLVEGPLLAPKRLVASDGFRAVNSVDRSIRRPLELRGLHQCQSHV